MKGKEELFGEWGSVIEWELKECFFEFRISRVITREMEPDIGYTVEEMCDGYTKWDGCTNLEYYSATHFCEPSEMILLHRSLKWCYEKARELLPNNLLDEWPQE
ncbi:MAG: hypothetical protein ACRCYD_11070 [Plesiomonas sp.]